MPDQWLTTKELSVLMKIPVTTIYDWRTVRRPCPLLFASASTCIGAA